MLGQTSYSVAFSVIYILVRQQRIGLRSDMQCKYTINPNPLVVTKGHSNDLSFKSVDPSKDGHQLQVGYIFFTLHKVIAK